MDQLPNFPSEKLIDDAKTTDGDLVEANSPENSTKPTNQQPFKALHRSIKCPNCKMQVITVTHAKPGIIVWVLCCIMFFLMFPCCIIPFFCSPCMDTLHICPECKKEIYRVAFIPN